VLDEWRDLSGELERFVSDARISATRLTELIPDLCVYVVWGAWFGGFEGRVWG
jgi:hypothetical protein